MRQELKQYELTVDSIIMDAKEVASFTCSYQLASGMTGDGKFKKINLVVRNGEALLEVALSKGDGKPDEIYHTTQLLEVAIRRYNSVVTGREL